MFCKNCGQQLADDAKFCNGCGNATGTANQPAVTTPVTQSAPAKPKGNGKRIGGIILAVLGGLSIVGSFANDYYWNIAHNGLGSSDIVTIAIQIGCVIGGAYLIYKSKKH